MVALRSLDLMDGLPFLIAEHVSFCEMLAEWPISLAKFLSP